MSSYQRFKPEGASSYQGADLNEVSVQSQIDDLRDEVRTMHLNNGKLQRLVAKMGTSADTSDFRSRLHSLEKKCKADAAKMIKRMKSLYKKQMNPEQQADAMKLSKKFSTIVETMGQMFEQIERRQGDIVNVMDSKSGNSRRNDDELLADDEQNIDARRQQAQTHQVDLQFLEYNATQIDQRRQNILQIAHDAQEIMEMSKDIQQMVTKQQESLTLMEENTSSARAKIDEGYEDLKISEDSANSARRKKVYLCLFFLVLIGLFALIIWGSSSD
jgi:hypothetical protein